MAIPCHVKFDHNGGAATPAAGDSAATPDEAWIDPDSGAVYLDSDLTEDFPSRITLPTWAGHTFLGYFDSPTGGTAYISRNGYAVASRFEAAGWSLMVELTLYARWSENFYRITVNYQGGTPDPGEGSIVRLYYDKINRGIYKNSALTIAATTVGTPTRECHRILGGFYTQPNGGGEKVLNSDGSIPSATQQMEFAGDTTFYARWTRVSYKITLDWNGGHDNAAGSARTELYFRVATGGDLPADRTYGDDQCGTLVTGFSTHRPERDGFSFGGYYANSDGTGTQYVNANGQVQNALKQPATAFTADFTIYAAWVQNSWVISLNKQNGTGGKSRLYNKLSTTEVYTDVGLATPFSNSNAITTPTRAGYGFDGYYSTASGSGTKYINSNGKPFDGNSGPIFKSWGKNASIFARWTAYRYTITFDANGGAFPGGATTQDRGGVEYGSAIGGTFPTPIRANHVFGGWLVDDKFITATTKYKWTDDITAYALWLDSFGNVTDYFGVEGGFGMSALMLVRADSGARRNTVATAGASSTTNGNITTIGAGKLAIQVADSAVAAYWAGNELINPVCTYRVKEAGSVSFTLGKAYRHPLGDFMLVAVEYRTRADGEPALVLRGVANEGADAINKWTVSLYVCPDHVAQDPLAAVSGGGELVTCDTVASAEPVVIYENGLPCASDIVRGRVAVKATTSAYGGEAAPSAGSGFLPVAAPRAEEDVDFTTYSFEAERSL